MFGPELSCLVVVGAQWGDEGKGKLVDVLAEQADVVVRYQGGANAGHTVVVGESQFILRLIPSGILNPHAICVLGNGVVIDPLALFEELDALAVRGIAASGRLLVSDRAHLVLPYHKLLDRAAERQQQLGTTGRGIGPTYEDKYGRRGIRAGQLRDLPEARRMLAEGVARANGVLALAQMPERASFEEHAALLEQISPRLLALVTDTGAVVHRALGERRRVLLEGAQGSLLDVDHGTYPFVTSSNTTAGGAAVGAGIGPTCIDGVLGVVKAYTTRVGNGPLPTVAEPAEEERLRRIGAEFGAVTGRPRRCGWFDATVVRYAARINGLTALAVTKLDVLDDFERIPVGVAYQIDGQRCEEMPSEVALLDRARPEYELLPGWRSSTTATRTLAELPRAARSYLDRLEALAGVPIRYVSVGTRRDQIIDAGS
ncbi:MAG TPA: adenylosuccinate synthase [Gemmatimonadales bacterium]|nr:adenylosuccinate synthase [Gemmatimonadales bacterium]